MSERKVSIFCPNEAEPDWRNAASRTAEEEMMKFGEPGVVSVQLNGSGHVKVHAEGFPDGADLRPLAKAISESFGGQFPLELTGPSGAAIQIGMNR